MTLCAFRLITLVVAVVLLTLVMGRDPLGRKVKYPNKYNPAWESDPKLKPWVQPVPGETSMAFFRYCKVKVQAHRSQLTRHQTSASHLEKSKPFSAARSLTDYGFNSQVPNDSVKTIELKTAVFTAVHSSIRSYDHLGEKMKDVSGKDVNIHRTKCGALIKNVVAPTMKEELVKDIKGSKYSLIIDESTDITTDKKIALLFATSVYSYFKLCARFLEF